MVAILAESAVGAASASGIDFSLTEDQELMRQEVRRFAEERIRPGVAERDREHRFPEEVLREMGEMGLLGMIIPEEYGGPGLDTLTYLLAMEEIACVCPATSVTMSVTNSVCSWPIVQFGSEDLKRRVLPPLATGEALGGFGLTEPSSGSDAASLRTTARRDGDFWVLDGEKAWITNAGYARYYVVVARTDPQAGKRGLSAFVVSSDAPGFSVGQPEEKMGLNASRTAHIYFNGCRVPAGNLLGQEGQGLKIAFATLEPFTAGHRGAGGRHPPAGVRAGHRVRQGPGAVRGAHRAAPGDPVQDRPDGDRACRGAHSDARSRRPRPHAARRAFRRAGQALRLGSRQPRLCREPADPRRQRLPCRLRDLPPLPRRARHHDL